MNFGWASLNRAILNWWWGSAVSRSSLPFHLKLLGNCWLEKCHGHWRNYFKGLLFSIGKPWIGIGFQKIQSHRNKSETNRFHIFFIALAMFWVWLQNGFLVFTIQLHNFLGWSNFLKGLTSSWMLKRRSSKFKRSPECRKWGLPLTLCRNMAFLLCGKGNISPKFAEIWPRNGWWVITRIFPICAATDLQNRWWRIAIWTHEIQDIAQTSTDLIYGMHSFSQPIK